MSNIILDTHILLWTLLEPNRLSEKIKNIIPKAQDSDNLFISSITLWEIAMLISKKRINVFEPTVTFLNSISNIQGLNIAQINASISADSCSLVDFHGDPADRLIVSTTRELSGSLVTQDQKILDFADQGFVKVIH